VTIQPSDLERIASFWRIRPRRIRPDRIIAGSPERVLSRLVLEDGDGALWILEEVAPAEAPQKQRQAEILHGLKRAGLQFIHSYLRDRNGCWITGEEEHRWMLRPFVEGVPPKRPDYALDPWRGEAMGTFLRSLRRATRFLAREIQGPPFLLEAFIRDLLERIRHRDPGLLPGLRPAVRHLESRLFSVLDGLPAAFCHGDYHPLNVIWSEKAMRSVIDWEFCGLKTEAYDAALLLGCIGMEDPRALAGPFAQAFLAEVRREGLLSRASLSRLFALVVAVRFLWLSEWLRGRDMDMVRLEVDYLDLLLANERVIRMGWELPS
jgi:homoserine kinase type II